MIIFVRLVGSKLSGIRNLELTDNWYIVYEGKEEESSVEFNFSTAQLTELYGVHSEVLNDIDIVPNVVAGVVGRDYGHMFGISIGVKHWAFSHDSKSSGDKRSERDSLR